jgi:hypothetical protein
VRLRPHEISASVVPPCNPGAAIESGASDAHSSSSPAPQLRRSDGVDRPCLAELADGPDEGSSYPSMVRADEPAAALAAQNRSVAAPSPIGIGLKGSSE